MKRIKNLSFQKATYLCDPPEHIGYQICKWEKNPKYNKESEYIKVDSEFYCYPDDHHFKIHKECFKHPETNYAIASFTYNKYEGCYELEFVGGRPMDLNEDERKIFWELLEYGFNKLNKLN